MLNLPHPHRSVLRVTIALGIFFLTILPVCFAQSNGRSQDVINAEQSGRLESLDQRVTRIERVEPATIAIRLQNLEEKVNDQQKLLYGILAAVITSLLTGNTKLPFSVKRRTDERL